MTKSEWVSLKVIVVAIFVGYVVVNWCFKLFKTKTATSENTSSEKKSAPPPKETRKEQARQWRENQQQRDSETSQSYAAEVRHGAVLGLKGKVTPDDVRRAYRELLSKYHPDKVSHLGIEFKAIAEERTKQIITAYDYFKRKYNI